VETEEGTRETGGSTGSSEFVRRRMDGDMEDSGEASGVNHDTPSDSIPSSREKRKGKLRRGVKDRSREGEEMQESALRNSYKAQEDDADEDQRRAKQKKSQTPLRFSVTDSAESSEREKGEPRKGRKMLGNDGTRRRKHQRGKGEKETEEDEINDDKEPKKRGTHRKTKKKAGDDSTSSSSRLVLYTDDHNHSILTKSLAKANETRKRPTPRGISGTPVAVLLIVVTLVASLRTDQEREEECTKTEKKGERRRFE
jgi:hypothetical protein